jgi:hypothetical protein
MEGQVTLQIAADLDCPFLLLGFVFQHLQLPHGSPSSVSLPFFFLIFFSITCHSAFLSFPALCGLAGLPNPDLSPPPLVPR